MGKQKNIQLVGTHANLVCYIMNGIPVMRSRPASVKRSETSKAAAQNFGLANKTEKALRTILAPVLPPVADKKKMRLSFVTAINRWLHTKPLDTVLTTNNIPFVTRFEFNGQSLLTERLRVPLAVSRTPDSKLLLQIPALNPVQSIAAPANSTSIIVTIIAAACNIDTTVATGSFTTQLNIPYTNTSLPAQDIVLDIITAPRCLTVVAAALQYHTNKTGNENAVMNLRWLPVRIVEGVYN